MAKEDRDLMGYGALQQEALLGVVRAALKRAAATGLPGDHHFLITFKTHAAGVSGPADLFDRYPDEMMIVLQHRFWDLVAAETSFSVTLTFGGQPKSLSIPYVAITEFQDPAADYRLIFDIDEAAEPAPPPAAKPEPPAARSETGDEPKIVSLDQFRKK